MGRTARALRGFLAHDERIDFDHLVANTGTALASSYTQAGPQPGAPVPADSRGRLLVHASNGQDADLDVRVIRPGAPKIDGVGALYREDGEADTSFRGWSEPNLVTGYVPVEWTTTEDWTDADACRIPSTQQVVAIAADTEATAPQQVSTWTWSPITRTWGARVEPDSANTRTTCAILCLRANERLIAFQCAPASGALFAHYSDDAGATWALYANPLRASVIDATVDRIRVIEDAFGGLLLLATDLATGNWWLYRSDDSGMSFALSSSGSAWGGQQSMALLPNGRILVVYRENGTQDAKSIVLEDSYDTITGATGTAIDGTNNVTAAECWVDDDGAAYVLLRVAASDKWKLARSVDNAATWTVYTHNPLGVGSSTVPADHVSRLLAVAPSGGELVCLLATQHATAPTTDGSLLSIVLGGWSTIESADATGLRTGRNSFASDTGTLGDSSVYLPGETFANHGWTPTGTGETLIAGYHRFNPAAATSFATRTTTYPAGGLGGILVEIQVVSGGSTTTNACHFSATRNDGANARRVVIRCSTTQFAVWDDVAGTQIGATVTVDMTTMMQFLIYYGDDNNASILYKRPASSIWLLVGQKDPCAGGLTPSTNAVYVIGCGTATTSDMRVGLLAFGAGLMLLRGLADDASYTAQMRWGKALGTLPYPVRDQGGSLVTHLAASAGPGRYAEQVDLPTVYDYGVREVLPQESPSPAARWRTTTTATEAILTWDLGADSRLGQSWGLALLLAGVNFRQAHLEVSAVADAGVWTDLGTWDAAFAPSVRFVRTGDLIVPDTTGTPAPRWLASGWLTGGTVNLDPAGTPKLRRIRGHSAGGWGPGSQLKPGILLDGIDGTEPTSGVCHIQAPAGVLVVHERATAFRYIRVRIPVQNVAESYYELGQVLLGSLYAPGRQWSRGWSWRENQQLDLEEDDAGTLWAGRRRARRRELTVSWQDGYDASALRGGLQAPYLSAGPGTPPLVADQDVWWALSGLLLAAQGGALPVVALAEIPQSSGMVLDPTMFLPGMLTGTLQANNVQGDEGRSEVTRVESLTVVELV